MPSKNNASPSLDDYLKSIQAPTVSDHSTEDPGPAEPSAAPPGEENFDWQQRAGKGVAKSLAAGVTGIPRALNAGLSFFAPETANTLGELAERVPGVKRMEAFAAEPSTSWAESGGNVLGQGAMLLMGPGEIGLGGKLASMFPKPMFAGKGAGFVNAPRPWLETAGRTAEYAGRGAAAGAMTDPSDPGLGALAGAVTGGGGHLAGKGLQTATGQWLGGQIARRGPYAAIAGLAHMYGVPVNWLWNTGLAEAILFYHAPWGRTLNRWGRAGSRGLGRLLERADPRIPGAASGNVGSYLDSPSTPNYDTEEAPAPQEAE